MPIINPFDIENNDENNQYQDILNEYNLGNTEKEYKNILDDYYTSKEEYKTKEKDNEDAYIESLKAKQKKAEEDKTIPSTFEALLFPGRYFGEYQKADEEKKKKIKESILSPISSFKSASDSAVIDLKQSLDEFKGRSVKYFEPLKEDETFNSKAIGQAFDIGVQSAYMGSKIGEGIIAPVFSSTMSFFGVKPSEDGVVSTIGKTFDYLGKKSVNLINMIPGVELDYFQSKRVETVAPDIITATATGGAGFALKKGIKGLKKIKYIRKVTAEESIKNIDKIITKAEKTYEGNNFHKLDTKKVKNDLLALEEGIHKMTISNKDIDIVIKEAGLPKSSGKYFKRRLSNARKNLKVKANAETISRIIKGKKNSTVKKIKNEFYQAGYKPNLPIKEKKAIKAKIASKYGDSNADSIFNHLEKNSDENVIKTITDYNLTKRTDIPGSEKLYDDGVNSIIKSESLYNGIEKGLVVKDGKSFKYTEKGIKVVRDVYPDIPIEKLEVYQKKGFAHIPDDEWNMFIAQKNGDTIPLIEAKIIYDEISGSKELNLIKELIIEKSTEGAKSSDLIDSSIIAIMRQLDDKMGLKINFNKIVDETTGIINKTELNKQIKYLTDIQKNEFLNYGKIYNPKKIKNIKQELGWNEKLYRRLYKEGEKNANIKANKKALEIKKEYNRKIQSLKNRNKLNKANAYLEKLRLKDKIREVRMAFGDIIGAKSDIIKNLKDINYGEIINNEISKAVGKFAKTDIWTKAKTFNQLNNATKSLDKAIVKAYAVGIKKSLIKEVEGIRKITKNSPIHLRKRYDVETQSLLVEVKELLKAGKLDKGFDVVSAKRVLDDIKRLKSNSRKVMKRLEMEDNIRINKKIDSIKKQKINKIIGKDDINKMEDGFFEKAKKRLKGYKNMLTFTTRVFEDMFGGRNTIGYKSTIIVGRKAINNAEIFITKTLEPLLQNLYSLLGDDARDFTTFMFALQRNFDDINPFNGLERMRNSKTYKHLFEVDLDTKYIYSFDEVKDFLPYTKEVWDEIKDTKLASILVKGKDKNFAEARKALNRYNKIIHKLTNDVSIKYDGIEIPELEDYLPYDITKRKGKIEADFDGDKIMKTKISDSFTKDRIKSTKGLGLEYEPDLFNIMMGKGKQAVRYAFVKPTYEDIVKIFNGKRFKVKNMDGEKLKRFQDNEQYYLVNSKGDIIDNTQYDIVKGEVRINGEIEKGPTYFQSKDGIINYIGEGGKGVVNDFLKTLANGGENGGEWARVGAKVIAQANLNPMIFNPSPALKQPLSLIDASGQLGARAVTKGTLEVITNSKLRKQLEEIPSVFLRGADPVIKEIDTLINTEGFLGKVKLGYSKYYVKPGTYLLKMLDKETYKAIWYTAYKKALKDKGLTFDGTFKNKEAIGIADDIAEDIASTANPIMTPRVYKNVVAKSFFGLYTTQLNRYQKAMRAIPDIWKKGKTGVERMRAIKTALYYTTANIAEYSIGMAVGKILYDLGLSTYEGYNRDFGNLIELNDMLLSITIGQTYSAGHLLSIGQGFSMSPIMGTIRKIEQDMKQLYKGNPEEFLDIVKHIYGGKLPDYIINYFKK